MQTGPTLAELVAAVERRGPQAAPLDQLGVAVELSTELREIGDQLVDRYVQAARADGRSWSEVGAVLGVSKQAAQQRFVGVLDLAGWPRHFTADARDAVARGERAARALGHNYLGTEHVLLGLAQQDRGLASTTLARLGIDAGLVRERTERLVGRGDGQSPQCLGVAPRVKRAFEAARREAAELGHREVRSEHLLLALAATRGGVAARILAEAGAHERDVRSELARQLEGEAPELAARLTADRRRTMLRGRHLPRHG
jgi:Clp amino terminal domain, pathogenicity island component